MSGERNDKQTFVDAELTINGFTNEGAGVGRLNNMAVFVPGALPHEKVLARLVAVKKNFAQAKLLQVLEPSPRRVAADCPLFGRCGGCCLQHADYQEQLKLKNGLVAASVARIGKLDTEIRPIIGSPLQLGYRDRISYHALHVPNKLELGFFMYQSKVFIPATVCMLPQEPIRALAKRLPAMLKDSCPDLRDAVIRSNDQGRLLLTLVGDNIREPQTLARELLKAEPRLAAVWQCAGKPKFGIFGTDWRLLGGDTRFFNKTAGVKMALSPATFTQVNPAQTETLYRLAAEAAALTPDSELLDLYSGAGAISLYLADKVKNVTGVEAYPPAVTDAIYNAQLNGITNCRFLTGKAEEVLPRLAAEGQKADAAIVDPPRAGCAGPVLEALRQIAPRRIVYVSCEPPTLARDMRWLADNGYQARFVQPVDMFPQTARVECVALLERTGD